MQNLFHGSHVTMKSPSKCRSVPPSHLQSCLCRQWLFFTESLVSCRKMIQQLGKLWCLQIVWSLVRKYQYSLVSIDFKFCCIQFTKGIFFLGLTYRAAKNQKPGPVIPKAPLFHDENDGESNVEASPGQSPIFNISENIDPSNGEEIEMVENSMSEVLPNVVYVKPAPPLNCVSNIIWNLVCKIIAHTSKISPWKILGTLSQKMLWKFDWWILVDITYYLTRV